MKRLKPDFKDKATNSVSYYDLIDDWHLIEASFAKQYGIRLRQHASTMPWSEFVSLASGLMPDTPLGQIVSIRAEKDRKTIKSFTPEQRKIHFDWKRRQAQKQLENPEQLEKAMDDLTRYLSTMFGKGGEKR